MLYFRKMTAKLDNRPLLGTIDRDLFIAPEIFPELKGAVDRRLNTLVLGPSGSGKTTLLRALAADYAEMERPVVYVDLGPAESARDALLVIGDALGKPWGIGDALLKGMTPVSTSSGELLRLARRLGEARESLILVDSPPGGGNAHTLFGRLRDELWQQPHQWVVAAADVLRDELTRPPANVFFDVQFELRPFSTPQQRKFLQRRLEQEQGIDVEAMVDETDGFPRSLLKLARSVVLANHDVSGVLARREAQHERFSELPRVAAGILAHIEENGPTSGSDPQLLAALGVSGQRARQVLRDLEDRDIVRSFTEQEERRGRPRKLYDLIEEAP